MWHPDDRRVLVEGEVGVEEPVSIGSGDFGDIWIVTMQGEEVTSVETSHFGD